MKILFASAEAIPYYKTGGLGDVARALPDALHARGHDVRIIHPSYAHMHARTDAAALDHTEAVDWPSGPLETSFHFDPAATGAPAVLVRQPRMFEREAPYANVGGDPAAPGRRFAFFARAAVAYARQWRPDVVHLNDWQTGLVPIYALVDGVELPSVYTIHNLAYQGNFPPLILDELGIPPEFYRTENGLEFHRQVSFMKAGVALADRLVTVSPSYAREIQTIEYGAGLDGLLRFRKRALTGILNGINTAVWDAQEDSAIAARYGPTTLARKDRNRDALLHEFTLDDGGPVFAMVTRLAHQKGIDLVLAAVDALVERGVRLVVLGDGDAHTESQFAAAMQRHPAHVAAVFRFDDALAHRIYAGADFFLMPSLYEPCGLGQMIAQRYGTPPVARRTGGLADTIEDGATGFLFDQPTTAAMLDAVDRARRIWRKRGWHTLRQRCMRLDRSWDASAGRYEDVYRLAIGALT